MKFCDPHWQALRKGVQDRGLWHLVAQGGAELAARMEREIEDGKSTAASYDPLQAATFAIYGRAIEAGGLYLMCERPGGGQYCPLCELDAHAPPPNPGDPLASVLWIDGCLDAQRKHAQDLGLMAPSS